MEPTINFIYMYEPVVVSDTLQPTGLTLKKDGKRQGKSFFASHSPLRVAVVAMAGVRLQKGHYYRCLIGFMDTAKNPLAVPEWGRGLTWNKLSIFEEVEESDVIPAELTTLSDFLARAPQSKISIRNGDAIRLYSPVGRLMWEARATIEVDNAVTLKSYIGDEPEPVSYVMTVNKQ